MKIALLTYGMRPQNPGGVTVGIIRILEMLSLAKDINVDIFNFADNINNEFPGFVNTEEIQSGIFVSSFGNYRVYNITSSLPLLECMRFRTRPKLRELLANYEMVIVRTGLLQFANVLPSLKQRVVIIVSTRLKWERQSQYKSMSPLKRNILRVQYPVLQFQEKRVLKSLRHFSVENKIMQNWIFSKTNEEPRIWYPVAKAELEIYRIDPKLRCNTYFISVGRLNEPRKGWSRLMNAYKVAFEVDRTLPPLKIIGWGNFNLEDKKTFEALRNNYPIRLYSNVSDEEKMMHLSKAFFFLQASFEEGLGYVGIEALSLGIPLICSDTFGSREYVRPTENGFLIDQGDNFIGRFSESILATRTVDYESMSKNALEIHAQSFSFKRSKIDFFKIFPELFSAENE